MVARLSKRRTTVPVRAQSSDRTKQKVHDCVKTRLRIVTGQVWRCTTVTVQKATRPSKTCVAVSNSDKTRLEVHSSATAAARK